jgi:hypothetical protein
MHAIGARGHGMGERTTSGFLIFNPPRDAEPSVIGDRPSSRADSVEQDTPTVLTKLQKWVGLAFIYTSHMKTQILYLPAFSSVGRFTQMGKFEAAARTSLQHPFIALSQKEREKPGQPIALHIDVSHLLIRPLLLFVYLQADYPSVGAPVAPTKFLPMKTPMSMEIITNWSLPVPPKHSLTVQELLQSEASAGRKVGLIIDLANHECLYQEDLPEDMEYAHIQLIAKVLPSRESIDEVQAVAQVR